MPTEATPLKSGLLPKASAEKAACLDYITKASWHVEDAARGLPAQDLSEVTVQHRAQYLASECMRYPWRGLVVVGLMVLSYFELPLWCLGLRHGAYRYPWDFNKATCEAPDGGQIYLFGTPYLPVGWS